MLARAKSLAWQVRQVLRILAGPMSEKARGMVVLPPRASTWALERDGDSAHEDDVVQQAADFTARGRSDNLTREGSDEVVDFQAHLGALGDSGLKAASDAAQTLRFVRVSE